MTYKILADTETQIKYVSYTLDGVEYKIAPISDNEGLRHHTEAEAEIRAKEVKNWNSKSDERKLNQIKKLRLQKLQETDWMANSDLTMSDAWKTKRQAWRDIPQNNSTETEYDALLTRDADGNLTNTIWSDA